MKSDKLVLGRLKIEIYTIGYVSKGESIIFIVKSDSEIFYTGVIDSYEKDGMHKTVQLLKKLEIDRIDMLCWSHPDLDHSKGLEQLFSYLDENSVFVIPTMVIEYNAKIKDNFKEIWYFLENEQLNIGEQRRRKYKAKNCAIQYISKNTIVEKLPCRFFVKDSKKYQFEISCFLPDSKSAYTGEFNLRAIEENGFSVGLVLQLGEFCAVFASDCNDKYIKLIDRMQFTEYCDFLKIPHHGSGTSTSILEYFQEAIGHGANIEVATVTVYTKRLPKEEAIDLYKKASNHVFFTNQNTLKKNSYGIIKVTVDVTDDDMVYSHKFYGNAGEI